MLQETVWALSNIQRTLRQVSTIKGKIISKVSIISKFVLILKFSIKKVTINNISIIKS